MRDNVVGKKPKFKVQPKKFLRNFVLWMLGIPINVIPILFKQLNTVTASDFPGIPQLILMILSDFDFSFISISVLFILCIEGYFVDDEISDWYRGFQMCSFICFCILLVLYCVFFFKPDLFAIMNCNLRIKYNVVIIIATIVFGLLCNIGISMKVSEPV